MDEPGVVTEQENIIDEFGVENVSDEKVHRCPREDERGRVRTG